MVYRGLVRASMEMCWWICEPNSEQIHSNVMENHFCGHHGPMTHSECDDCNPLPLCLFHGTSCGWSAAEWIPWGSGQE